MALTGDATQLLYATYLGGTSSRTHLDGGTCRFDKGGVVYHAVCSGCEPFNGTNKSTSDFPTTAGAWSRTNGSANCNNAAFKFDLSSLKASIQTNATSLNKPGLNKICLADSIVFQNQSLGGQTYYWDFGDGSKTTKTDRLNILFKYNKPGNYLVKLKAVDIGTCVGKDSTKTSVLVSSPLGFAGPDIVMCYNAGTQLTAGGGVTYQWIASDKSFTSSQAIPTVNPKLTTPYFISVTDVNGCIIKDTVNVRVVPGMDLQFTAERVNYDCANRPDVKVIDLTNSNENALFDFGDGTTSDLPNLVHSYSKDGLYPIRLIGKREACVYEKEISIPVFELMIPNVFTPEQSPGYNDTFQILYGGKPIFQSGINVSLLIYNRWGGKVFESKSYLGDWAAKDVASGTYYYEAKIEGVTSCKGWVQVVK
jgi:PKD repeat protein